MSLIFPKKEILYAPMLGTFGGGSARGFGRGGGGSPAVGEHVFYGGLSYSSNDGSLYTFIVPDGVEFISILSVGGGGAGADQHDGCGGGGGALAYKNNVAVTAGQSITVRAGTGGRTSQTTSRTNQTGAEGGQSYANVDGIATAIANGGLGGNNGYATGRQNGASFGAADGGGEGGRLTRVSGTRTGGAGAGGYSGNGGDAGGYFYNSSYGATDPATNSGGGGGGEGANGGNANYCSGGGGVGIYGKGADGQRSARLNPTIGAALGGSGAGYSAVGAGNHSGGAPNGFGDVNRDFGGGGGGAHNSDYAGNGGQGVVRIIWGEGRSFPSTNVDLASSEGNVFLN